jgi:hypothetical protein
VIAKWERQFFLEKGETVTTRNTGEKDYLAVDNQIPDDFKLNETGILFSVQAKSGKACPKIKVSRSREVRSDNC